MSYEMFIEISAGRDHLQDTDIDGILEGSAYDVVVAFAKECRVLCSKGESTDDDR
jgi:hypothetical protein